MLSHVLACEVPDGQQHALSFVVAGTILVRLAEIAERDRSINCGDDLGEANLICGSRKYVSTTHAALALDQPRTFKCKENLLQIGLRQTCAVSNVADAGWPGGILMQSERQQGPTCIISTG